MSRARSQILTAWLGGLLVGMTLFASTAARADYFLHFWEDHYEPLHSVFLDLEASSYSSSQNFDPSGNKFLPTNLTSYKRYEGDGLLSLGITDSISLFGRAAISQVSLSASTSYSGNATGLGDQSIGADWRVFQSQVSASAASKRPTTIDLQLEADIPAYNNTSADTAHTPYLGDGTFDVTFGGFVRLPFAQTTSGDFVLTAGLGYEYRSASYSAAVPWSVLAKFERHSSGFIFNAGILGYQSLKNDGRGIAVANTSALNSLSPGSGGSFMTSAINPSLIRLRGTLGYQLDSGSAFLVAVDQSVWGQDTPYGTLVSLGFQTHFGEDSSQHPSKSGSRMKPLRQQGFLNYSMDAHILRSNDRLNLVKIDKGEGDGVSVGQIFDIYKPLPDGSAGEAVARSEVVSVKSGEAALSIVEYYKEIFIEEGFLAKRLIQN